VNNDLGLIDPRVVVENRELSCISEIERGLSFGKQTYAESDSKGVVGKSVIHSSAVKQVTGEAQYVDDLPPQAGELYGVILGSTVAHGKIVSIDVTECLAYPGVFGFVSAKDLDPNMNIIGPVFKDEELFATEYVYHVGQMIGLVLGTSEVAARIAVKLCKVKYDVLPVILTIEDAIESKSFLDVERKLLRGEFSENNKNGTGIPLASAALTVSGTARMSGQEHFYLETNATLVVPGAEDDEVEVFASTQHPSETQHLVAHVLGIQSNKVVCRVKRLGGGFGGKETRSVFLSCALAVAAKKYKRPVRCMLTREEDMAITGTRHPFRGDYKVGFTSDGYIISLELDMYCNAGYSMDLSFSVLERSMTHCDNAYFIPHVKIIGRMCKTNIPTNTAFRGFGGPQGMMVAEQYITHVAEFLKKPVEEIRV
jgi:xanthine dehydrogenase/oxidase